MRKKLPLNACKIKYYRITKCMSVIELAKKTKLSRASIYNYENGIQMPTGKRLIKIAKVLGVDPKDLVG